MTQQKTLDGVMIYAVGGVVRDQLLGLPAGDCDWVVVGATPEQMVANDYTPVGGDFPVFLHPETKEEYALARTERKSGRGYQGFTFYTGTDVTLEQDLLRRDLTVNAMALRQEGQAFLAQEAERMGRAELSIALGGGEYDEQLCAGDDPLLVDPFGGLADLRAKVLRHVSEAFVEDPVRVLRLARFLARFDEFSVAQETRQYCQAMVQAGEVDHLVAERVWQEISRALMQPQPARCFDFLEEVGALARVMPGLEWDQTSAESLALAVEMNLSLDFRYALLAYRVDDIKTFSRNLKVPSSCQAAALLLAQWLESMTQMRPEATAIVDAILATDAMRKPERFKELLQAYGIVKRVQGAQASDVEAELQQWQQWADVVCGVDAGAIAKACGRDTKRIKEAVYDARVEAVASVIANESVLYLYGL